MIFSIPTIRLNVLLNTLGSPVWPVVVSLAQTQSGNLVLQQGTIQFPITYPIKRKVSHAFQTKRLKGLWCVRALVPVPFSLTSIQRRLPLSQLLRLARTIYTSLAPVCSPPMPCHPIRVGDLQAIFQEVYKHFLNLGIPLRMSPSRQ